MAKQKDIIQAIVDDRLSQLVTPESENGLSAYELAVQEGYSGTLQEWLLSLHGEDGEDGITQDISNLVVKETGKGLSTNDYLTEDKNKLTTLPIITVSATPPQTPVLNQIWIDIS